MCPNIVYHTSLEKTYINYTLSRLVQIVANAITAPNADRHTRRHVQLFRELFKQRVQDRLTVHTHSLNATGWQKGNGQISAISVVIGCSNYVLITHGVKVDILITNRWHYDLSVNIPISRTCQLRGIRSGPVATQFIRCDGSHENIQLSTV